MIPSPTSLVAQDPPLPLLPTEVWERILALLPKDKKRVSLVCKQFLHAMRAGVLSVSVPIPRGHSLSFLLTERFNNFPGLRFVDIETLDPGRRHPSRKRKRAEMDLLPVRQRTCMGLRLQSVGWVREAVTVANQQPDLAAMVTHVSIPGEINDIAFDDVWPLLERLPNLLRLELIGVKGLTDDRLRRLATLPTLRHLKLNGCHDFTGEAMDALISPACGLQSLVLRRCDAFDSQHLSRLTPSPHLQKLVLAGCDRVQTQHLKALGQCEALKHLALRFVPITEAEVRQLAQFLPQLERLGLASSEDLTADTIAAVAEMNKLQRLELQGQSRLSLPAVFSLVSKLPELSEFACPGFSWKSNNDPGKLLNARGQEVVLRHRWRHAG